MIRSSIIQYLVWICALCGQILRLRWRIAAAAGAIALSLPTGPILAQTNPVAAPAVRFTVFAAEPIEGLGYAPQPGGAVVRLTFYPTARSPRYEHRGRQPLQLVDTRTGETVAEATIPDGVREALLLVSSTKDATGPARYQVTVLDDGPRQRGVGQIQILNLSGLELAGELNGRRIGLESGLNPAVSAGRSARLVLRASFRGRSYLSWHDTIPLGPPDRALLILFPPYLAGSLEVQTRVLLDEPPAALPAGR